MFDLLYTVDSMWRLLFSDFSGFSDSRTNVVYFLCEGLETNLNLAFQLVLWMSNCSVVDFKPN